MKGVERVSDRPTDTEPVAAAKAPQGAPEGARTAPVSDEVVSTSVAAHVIAELEPSPSDRAWALAIARWVDAELRSTPVAHHPPGWEYLLGTALPKLRSYVERELEGS